MARREYPGVYPYPASGGRTLYRTLYTDSNGRQRQKRGFSSPRAAAKFRARMQVRAERGELRITRETFAEHFDSTTRSYAAAGRPEDILSRYRPHQRLPRATATLDDTNRLSGRGLLSARPESCCGSEKIK